MRDDLARCSMSIHLVGKTYSLTPEGATASLVEIQNELAIERGDGAGLHALSGFRRACRSRTRASNSSSIGCGWIRAWGRSRSAGIAAGGSADRHPARSKRASEKPAPRLRRFRQRRGEWRRERLPPLRPARRGRRRALGRFPVRPGLRGHSPGLRGRRGEVREYHEENLRTSDGVVIFFGAANEVWLRRKLRELQKSAGYGRTKPAPVVGVCLLRRKHRKRNVSAPTKPCHPPVGRAVARALAADPRSPEGMSVFNPFPGLRPFEPDEDHLFFGREKEIDELLRRLRSTRFLSVVGTSGSGKSSLVRSGLIPSLHSGFMVSRLELARGDAPARRRSDRPPGRRARPVGRTRPDEASRRDRPRSAVDATLRRGTLGWSTPSGTPEFPTGDNLLVVVDQFEELFRFRRSRQIDNSRDEAIAFVKLLLEATRQTALPIYVVLTMRSDFIGDCMEYPGLPEAVNNGQYLVPRMTRDELGRPSPVRSRSAAANYAAAGPAAAERARRQPGPAARAAARADAHVGLLGAPSPARRADRPRRLRSDRHAAARAVAPRRRGLPGDGAGTAAGRSPSGCSRR